MYKISLIILLFFQGCLLFGQPHSLTSINNDDQFASYSEINLNLLNKWVDDQNLNFIPNISFPLLAKHKTPNAIYFRYQIAIDSIPVYGKQFLIQYNRLNKLNQFVSPKLKLAQTGVYKVKPDYWHETKSGLIPIYLNQSKSSSQHLLFENTNHGFELKKSTILGKKDSLITVQVFYPDPITSSKKAYGIPYADLHNGINSDLLTEHFIKEMKTTFSNDTFKLESDYFLINEHSNPVDPIWYSLTDSAIYDRSNSNFEAINISFHINKFRNYLNEIHYQQLGNRQILVDPHGFEGADLSSFNNLKQPVELTFGTGGVDDGEDAGIIIHEYAHSLTDHASPKSNLGNQRMGIEEGLCDFVAASYIRDISEYRWQDLYKWDGHNEFWSGRTIDFSALYPNDTAGTIYETGGIISATLMELWPIMGKLKLDSLVFESMYSLMPNMSLLEYADLLIQTEDLLFSGHYKNDVCEALNAHGLGKPCFYSSINPMGDFNPILINSENFAKGISDLIILTKNKNTEYRVINMIGEVLTAGQENSNEIKLSPMTFTQGIFIVEIYDHTQYYPIKIQRY